MAEDEELVPAAALAKYGHNYPNESPEYRRARTALLAEEIELRRHIERVAAQRRVLPPGGEIPEDYVFAGVNGPVHFSALFGHHDTLVVYNYMYGPKRERPCPMCTSLLSSWDGEAADMEQRVALAIVAKSPIERLVAFKKERGWRHLKLYSSAGNSFNKDYFADGPNGEDWAAINVSQTRRQDPAFLGWRDAATADPGQDPRGAPDLMPLWTVLDMTPAGRGKDWYPKLGYGAA